MQIGVWEGGGILLSPEVHLQFQKPSSSATMPTPRIATELEAEQWLVAWET